jgi:nicotinamidase/pyrazinamidase
MATGKAIIVIDVQRDFCQGGALAAVDTLSLLEPLQKSIEIARQRGDVIVYTQDWHPKTHKSFKPNGGKWPVHCVACSWGAELMPPLAVCLGDSLIKKGISPDDEGYSAFKATGLAEQLRSINIESIAVTGIATEFCVYASAKDAVEEGFKVYLLTDLVRPVDPKEPAAVLHKLENKGVIMMTSDQYFRK